MRFAGAFRLPGTAKPGTHLAAAVTTLLLGCAIGLALFRLIPSGCDLRGDPALYRWACLFPGLLLIVAPFAALLLPLAFALNDRHGRPIPDGWLATTLGTGLAAHLVVAGWYLLVLDSAYHRRFLLEAMSIPQPLFAGTAAAAVYWTVLRLGLRRA